MLSLEDNKHYMNELWWSIKERHDYEQNVLTQLEWGQTHNTRELGRQRFYVATLRFQLDKLEEICALQKNLET